MLDGGCRVRTCGLLAAVAVLLALSGCGDVAKCAAGTQSCNGTCVDLRNNGDHCGACGTVCGDGLTCGGGACIDRCALGEVACGGSCANTDTDATHCGACNNACEDGDVCTGGICHAPCDETKLTSAITDPWGNVWDGLERAPAVLDVATTTCAEFGGVLPMATDIYRASAVQSGSVGQSFHTSFLWSRVPNDRLEQATVRLSDGATSTAAAATAQPYRCICPAVAPSYFTQSRCSGPAADGCFAYGKYNIDRADRPALRKSASVWECAQSHAHMLDLPLLLPAIRAGLPGSGKPISTADAASYQSTTTVKWSSDAWQLTEATGSNISSALLTAAVPFRCAGPAFETSFNATQVSNAFLPDNGVYKVDAADEPASKWAPAHDVCWQRGGHLPRETELVELIGQSLPGQGQVLWTSDQVGFQDNFLAAILQWNGIDQRFPYAYAAEAPAGFSASWAYKTNTHSFRCIYYPLDPTFAPPSACNGDCFMLSAGNPAATMYFDQADRPAATVADAAADCAASQGYLASERDLTEAIRGGLGGGSGASNTFIATWDLAQNAYFTIVKWTDAQPAFDDQYPTYMTWSDLVDKRPYRCMWTNELR